MLRPVGCAVLDDLGLYVRLALIIVPALSLMNPDLVVAGRAGADGVDLATATLSIIAHSVVGQELADVQSFRTRLLPDASKATPPITTSCFCALDNGFSTTWARTEGTLCGRLGLLGGL